MLLQLLDLICFWYHGAYTLKQLYWLLTFDLQTICHKRTLTQNHLKNQILAFRLTVSSCMQPLLNTRCDSVFQVHWVMPLKQRKRKIVVNVCIQRRLINSQLKVALCQFVVLQTHIHQSHTKQGIGILWISVCLLFEELYIIVSKITW